MRALSLFSGIGGIDLAAEWAGIETVAFCEYADFPRQVLNKHWPNVPIFKDVKKLSKSGLEKAGVIDRDKTIKLVHGGFPCQPYSSVGKRKGKDDDRDLWPEMFRIINELGPDWVVGENVANFANMELDRTLFDLENLGYETRTFVLPASAVGAWHQRSRTFIVANADSKRWDSVEVHQESGCRSFCQNCFDKQAWDQERAEASSILSRASGILADTSIRIHRNDDGISEGMDRLKSLGNAVVPQQIYPIFKAIMEIERVIYPTK